MDNLWIETGDMSGGSRNQIEFDADLAQFFVGDAGLPPTGGTISLSLSINGGPWTNCEIAAKRTTFDVDIYRLGLVTAARGGDEYPGRVIRFEKRAGRYFAVTVADLGSDEHDEWSASSEANETLSRTGGTGGREFGYF